MANVNSYISACKEDPVLKSFDSSLRQQTMNLFKSLDAKGKTDEYTSIDSVMGVYGFLLGLIQNVVKVITEYKDDLWKNEDLRSLVNVYFDSTTKTLNLLNTVDNCVGKAEHIQLTLRIAIKRFETESTDSTSGLGGNNKKNKYEKTLEELNKVKDMGDPFGEEFMTHYESVRKQQSLLTEELRTQIVKGEKKQKKVRNWLILSNVVFGAALVTDAVLVMSLSPPVVHMVAIGLSASLLTTGAWVNVMLVNYKDVLEAQDKLVRSMEKSAAINTQATYTIYSLVENLSDKIKWILKTAGVALEDEEELSTKYAMRTIMKKVDDFTDKIVEVGDNVAKNSKIIITGRNQVLGQIANSKGKY